MMKVLMQDQEIDLVEEIVQNSMRRTKESNAENVKVSGIYKLNVLMSLKRRISR